METVRNHISSTISRYAFEAALSGATAAQDGFVRFPMSSVLCTLPLAWNGSERYAASAICLTISSGRKRPGEGGAAAMVVKSRAVTRSERDARCGVIVRRSHVHSLLSPNSPCHHTGSGVTLLPPARPSSKGAEARIRYTLFHDPSQPPSDLPARAMDANLPPIMIKRSQ
jgi:hypothetical protein